MAGSVDAGVAVGQRDAERRLAFFDVFQHLQEAKTHSEAEGSMFFHVLSTGARPAAARLGALAAAPRRPTGAGDSAVDRLRHPAHGVGVLLALPFQLPVLEPFVERSGVHELLVPLAHQRVEVVGGVLLPELAQHLLLVPRLDAHHGLCLSQNSMVFRVSSSSKRSARESCLMALIAAGVGSGSTGSSAAATGAGTGAAARSGATSTVGGALGLFLLPGGLPLRLFGAATGCAAGGASSLAAAGSAPTSAVASAVGCPGCASASAAAVASSMLFFLQTSVQVDAEAQAGAAQVHHVALVVGELEAEVRDWAPDVEHVVLVGVRLHDVAHALLADDLGDDVVAQRPHRVGRVGQAAAVRLRLHEGEDLLFACLVDEAGAQQVVDAQGLAGRGALRVAAAARELRAQLLLVQDQPVAVVGHLQLVARLHVSGAGEVAADPGGQAHAGVGADGQLRPIQRAQGGVPPL